MSNADWAEEDIDTSPPNAPFFQRKIAEFGRRLRDISGAPCGYCAVSGIKASRFEPIFHFGGLTSKAIEDDIQVEIAGLHKRATLPMNRLLEDHWFVPLTGQHELYGFFKYFQVRHSAIAGAMEADWRQALEELSDHNYTRRVQFLSEPFSTEKTTEITFDEEAAEKQITHLTALSFGADGAVLRRWDDKAGLLSVARSEGDVPASLLTSRIGGELLSGAVITSQKFAWSVIELGEVSLVRGCEVSEETLKTLKDLGLRAAITARLDNPVRSSGPPFGTLAYFFRRPSRFSWRDVTLFLGFCKRAADALALARETTELRERNRVIETQSSAFTQAEVATLLVHDIAHKVFHVGENGEGLIEIVNKQLRNFRAQKSTAIIAANAELQQSIRDLQREVQDLKVVGKLTDADGSEFGVKTFSLVDLVDELTHSMSFALRRYSLSVRVEVPSELTITGARRVLYHVFLNLILNSIDAVRTKTRPATIHITAQLAGNNLVKIRFWDTGPGLNLSDLRTPGSIFKIGVTTKRGGTGLGLPMARNLLARYFNGSLDLVDSKNASFEMQIRKNND